MTDIERVLAVKITCSRGTDRHVLVRALEEIRSLRTQIHRLQNTLTQTLITGDQTDEAVPG